MSERRVFHLPGAICGPEPVPLPRQEAHHVAHVLRLAPGDRIGLLDGAGMEGEAEIVAVRRDKVHVRVIAMRPGRREPDRAVVLAAGLLKGARWDFLVEKATELGATHIVPLAGSRVVAASARRDRWARIALAAAKQSLRARIPAIDEPRTLEELLGAWPRAHVFLAEEEAAAGVPTAGLPPGDLLLVVGAEGGMTPAERGRLRAAGAREVSLGPRRLRSETAAIALLALFRPCFDPGEAHPPAGAGPPEGP